MEDRELTGVERELRRYLSAQLDPLTVRSAPDFSPSRRNWVRRAAFVPATMLVVLVAIGVGLGLADWRAHRTASDEPQAAAGGVPGPLALAGGAPSLGFGLVSTSANTLLVRNEVTEAAPLTFSSALPQVAVSPNGHDIAYWRVLPDRQTGQPVYELNRSDLLDSAVRDRLVLRAPVGEGSGPLIWSSDGTGLLANTHTPPTRGDAAGVASRPTQASWFKIDIASGKTEQLPQTFTDSFSVVYAWDRSRDLITGSTTSFGSPSVAGGPRFLTFTKGAIQSQSVPTGGIIAAADAYGKSVVIEYATGCQPSPTPRLCPALEARDQATFAITAAVPLAVASGDLPDVIFRPRSQDLIVQIPIANGDAQVELWADLGRGPHQILATYAKSVRFTGRRELMLPRVDGSAVFLLKFDNSAGGRWFGEVVALAPNGTNGGGQDSQRTPFEILTGGNPLASVVLDPAFARAMDPRLSATLPSAPSSSALPVCPGQLPILDVTQAPPPGDQPGNGAATPEAAFQKAFPTLKDYKMYAFGTTTAYVEQNHTPETFGGPVWIVAGDRTFIALHVGSPGLNSWFAHPATFLGCGTPATVGAAPLATATEGSRSAPASTAEIVARLNAAGLASRVSPPAPSRLLLYNAIDLDLIAVDDPAIKGFVVYRYPSVTAATAAFRLEAVQDPTRGTVDYVAKPYFVGIGDALVVFATNDATAAQRVVSALTSTP